MYATCGYTRGYTCGIHVDIHMSCLNSLKPITIANGTVTLVFDIWGGCTLHVHVLYYI